jgi:HEPN domain-containing protein
MSYWIRRKSRQFLHTCEISIWSSEGSPFEYFGRKQSEEAIEYAGEIVEFVNNEMAK